VWHGEHLSFPLKIKNYVDLRGDDFSVARILVVLVVPEAVDEWVVHSNEELLLRRSCYWTSLRTAPEVDNDTQVTVPIPKHQQFNVSTLRTIMQAIGNWNPP
jgi:hypothetical protein